MNENVIYKLSEFYSIRNYSSLADRRLKGNALAEAMIKRAGSNARFLAGFPYVRGVAISGSLSKDFADETADVDFFIITAPNRLWIARSFLHAFKKLTFLFNKQHWFCMNYFIDEVQPAILEKNIYTATEIATLLPLYGTESFEKFYASNAWMNKLLPNHIRRISSARPIKKNVLKFFVEKLFNNTIGEWLDNLLMKVTIRRWNKKEQTKNQKARGIILRLDAAKHHAKPDPANFQNKLLKHYETKLSAIFENLENIALSQKTL